VNDERLIELLSARADDALTAGESAELEALLAESADARRLAAHCRRRPA
jgi:anti-sigma factor RsiW